MISSSTNSSRPTFNVWFNITNCCIKNKDKIDEGNVGLIVSRIERVNKILQILVKQIDVLETMTSLDFLDFSHHLSPASGFQSHQFRKLEVMLGLKIKDRHQFGGCPYHNQFKGQKKNEILELEDSASLFTLIEKWLERWSYSKRIYTWCRKRN